MQKILNVAAYCRVSTEKEDQINSLTSQIQYFTDYINNHTNWKLVEVYYDDGISGTSTKKRAGFNRMISDANSNKINLIITKEISRFARNTLDSIYYTRQLKELGIGVIFISDNINTLDADSELRLTIMSSIAQEESRKTSERVKWGQKRRMEQGVVFGRDLLGYFVKNGKLLINENEVDIVKRIYHKYLNEGKGTHVIARELQEEGSKPKRASKWSNAMILRVLRNEKYVGDLIQKKTITPNYLNHVKKYNKNKEDLVCLKNHHEPIIDRVTWDNVQKELARRSPSHKFKYSNRYWCSGKIICGQCGATFVGRTKKLSDSIYKSWRCYNAANYGTAKGDDVGNCMGCNSNSVNEKVLLQCIRFVVNKIQVDKNAIIADLIGEIKSIQPTNTVTIKKLYERIERLRNKKVEVIHLHLDASISKDEMKRMNNELECEIKNTANKIAQASNTTQQTQADSMNSDIEKIRNILEYHQDNELIYQELLEKIIVINKNMIDIYLKCTPFGVRIQYATSGKLDKYKVTINQIEIVK